ncbi:unnamed protein product, partial [Ectocarpus sp. 12 AP-2014]
MHPAHEAIPGVVKRKPCANQFNTLLAVMKRREASSAKKISPSPSSLSPLIWFL